MFLGVVVAAGGDAYFLPLRNVFGQSQSAEYFMRFDVAQSTDPRIFEVLAEALAVSKAEDNA